MWGWVILKANLEFRARLDVVKIERGVNALTEQMAVYSAVYWCAVEIEETVGSVFILKYMWGNNLLILWDLRL